jgi:uncharacterized repeat protein (TIGR02543 family)
MRKIFIKMMIGLSLVLSSFFMLVPAKAASFNVSTFADLQSALSDGDSTIHITIEASFDVTDIITITAGKTVTITSKEDSLYTLTRDASVTGDMVYISSSGTLTISNIILDGNKTAVPDTSGAIVKVYGSFVMNEGAVLQNHSSAFVYGALTNMPGNGSTIINGGEIKFNEGGLGAGIINHGTMFIHGGSITDNQSTMYGGGIFNETTGTLTITGGEIARNEASQGGGIYNRNLVTISGGEFFGNNASDSGGAITHNPSTPPVDLTITGGSIHDNHAGTAGGGIAVSPTNLASVKVGADVEFANNSIDGNPAKLATADQDMYDTAIQTESFTSPFTSLYNNVDVEYSGEEVYVVTYQNGTDNEVINRVQVNPGEKLTKPADPQKDGYLFEDWYKDDTFNDLWDFDNDTVQESNTLYGKFIKEHTVTLMSEGIEIDSLKVLDQTAASRPADPIRNGYHFINWYEDESCRVVFAFDTLITDDKTLYACWQQNSEVVIPPVVNPPVNPDSGVYTGVVDSIQFWLVILPATLFLYLLWLYNKVKRTHASGFFRSKDES